MQSREKPNFEKLKWDTEFFGFGVGRLKADTLEEVQLAKVAAKESGLRLLYWPCPLETGGLAKSSLRTFVGDQISYSIQLSSHEPAIQKKDFDVISYEQSEPSPELVDLTLLAGWKSRFNIDPHISSSQFKRLYKIWIENSCNLVIADIVLVAVSKKSDLMGFVSVAIKNDVANIGLISVSTNYQKRGVATALLSSAKTFAQQHQCSTLTVSTQKENNSANILYQKNGFKLESQKSWFHIWTDQ